MICPRCETETSENLHCVFCKAEIKQRFTSRIVSSKSIAKTMLSDPIIVGALETDELDIICQFDELITPEFIKRMEQFD